MLVFLCANVAMSHSYVICVAKMIMLSNFGAKIYYPWHLPAMLFVVRLTDAPSFSAIVWKHLQMSICLILFG